MKWLRCLRRHRVRQLVIPVPVIGLRPKLRVIPEPTEPILDRHFAFGAEDPKDRRGFRGKAPSDKEWVEQYSNFVSLGVSYDAKIARTRLLEMAFPSRHSVSFEIGVLHTDKPTKEVIERS